MKKYIIIVSVIIVAVALFDYVHYHLGWYIPFPVDRVECSVKAEGKDIVIKDGGGFKRFEIKGVDMGSGIPSHHANDYETDKETYLRWFEQIQQMGANTIRIYTVLNSDFYEALYEYNTNARTPLYLLQGVWVNDYMHNSHRDAHSPEFVREFKDNCRVTVDVVYGERKITLGRKASHGTGSYQKDISPWVLGYIVGVDWTDATVAYTDQQYKDEKLSYNGKFMYTTQEATPFEVMLAEVGDALVEYETNKYGKQRLIAFSNYPQTDPFYYPEDVEELYAKCARVDAEHIKTTENFSSGHFASYHVYNYQTHILNYVEDISSLGFEGFYNENGVLDTYRTYLEMLNAHHEIPVVISEFGVSTARGSAYEYNGVSSPYGNCGEEEQGKLLAEEWNAIKSSGCAGGCVFEWQDEWYRHTWNTMYAVDTSRAQYWSDYQTGGQSFGLLSFDPGAEKSVCYVDGNAGEWKEEDIVSKGEALSLSYKYDEKFIYFMVNKDNLDFSNETLYIPLDITPKSGSNYCKNYNIKFDREADFVIVINGYDNSRVMVQERYDSLRSTYSSVINGFDTYRQENIPEKNSPEFVGINMILETKILNKDPAVQNLSKKFETGKLTYGNANPESADFNSLADFCSEGDCIEIKLPWQLVNFYDPSNMQIHDDYYDGNYGVEEIGIDKMYAGVCAAGADDRTVLSEIELIGWENNATYHERLKKSYYIMQELWIKE